MSLAVWWPDRATKAALGLRQAAAGLQPER